MLNPDSTPSATQRTADSSPAPVDIKAAMQRRLEQYMQETRQEFPHLAEPQPREQQPEQSMPKRRARSSITSDMIDDIVLLHAEGKSKQQIKRKMGLSLASVGRIVTGCHPNVTPEQREMLMGVGPKRHSPKEASVPVAQKGGDTAAVPKANRFEQVIAMFEEQIAVLQTENRTLRTKVAMALLR